MSLDLWPEEIGSESLRRIVDSADAVRAIFASAEREAARICWRLEAQAARGRDERAGEWLPGRSALTETKRNARQLRRLRTELGRHELAAREIARIRAQAVERASAERRALNVDDASIPAPEAMTTPIDGIGRRVAAATDRLRADLQSLQQRIDCGTPEGSSGTRPLTLAGRSGQSASSAEYASPEESADAAQSARRYSDKVLYRRLFGQARPYWRQLAATSLFWLLATPLTLLTPVPLKIAVDNVIGKHPLPGYLSWALPGGLAHSHVAVLVLATALMVLIVVLTEAQWLAAWLAGEYTGERMTLRFRSDLFAHAQRLSLAYHDRKGTSDSAYRIEWDAPSIQYLVVDGLIPFLASAMTVGSMLYVTFQLDWQLGLVALAISPLLFVMVQASRSRLRTQAHEIKGLESSALGVIQEVLSTLRVVKAFGQEPREHERFVRTSHDGMAARIRQALTEGSYSVGTALILGLGSGAVLYVGLDHVQAGALTLGSLILIIGYLTRLYEPLKTMSRQVGSLQMHLASADRAFSLLDEQMEIRERPGALPLARATGQISFCGVEFAYERDRTILQDVSFEVPPAARVGIFGPTGAGKTTILNLLMRLYDPTSGQILLDGRDLRDYRLADLRRQFAIVLQEPVLFATTIRENISYGRPDAPLDDVVAAAEAANVRGFIDRLPDGYETVVSERGVSLSGGERQRISIARAFLKDAPILMLDEPTSSVDTKTEAGILDAMSRLMAGRTTFMVAHRLSTLESCDIGLELREGRLVGSGTSALTMAG